MPLLIPDKAGFLRYRPKYTPDEIEELCENAITDVLRKRHSAGSRDNTNPPITDDDLLVLIEKLGADVTEDVDFSSEGSGWIQGETRFHPDKAPSVRIARGLGKNRQRSTKAHEGSHVLTQGDAYADRTNVINWDSAGRVSCGAKEIDQRCRRDGDRNWRERQADHGMGALLVPRGMLASVIGTPNPPKERYAVGSIDAQQLVSRVVSVFDVSIALATFRLRQLRYLVQPRRRKLPFGEPSGSSDFPKIRCDCFLCRAARNELEGR